MLAVNLGYRIDRANVENNNFSNNLSNPISRVRDWDNFAAMTYRNNRYIGLTGVGVFRGGGADIIQCGWKHADATAGLTRKPTDIYPGKVSQSIGDVVYNSSPIPVNFDFCYVAASGTTWGKVTLANA